MAFGPRSRGYGGRGSFRAPRGSGSQTSSFRGRGRGIGSDSYYGSSSRDSYYDKSHSQSHYTPSYKENNFRSTRGDDSYSVHSRISSSSRYGDRFASTRGNSKYSSDQNSYQRHGRESTSGSLGRDYSRRNVDSEPERKRFRTDSSGSYREGGPSPRKSYDTYEHAPRNSGFSASNNSATRSDSSSYGGKSPIPSSSTHRKEYLPFKKPLPPARGGRTEASSTLVKRGPRGRVLGSAAAPIRRTKPTISITLKRAATLNKVARSKAAARLQQTLRRKKQLRIMRMRKERQERLEAADSTRKIDENESPEEKKPDITDKTNENREHSAADKVGNKSDEKTNGHEADATKVKSGSSPERSASQSAESPGRGRFRERIVLKCSHCQVEYKTFRTYSYHLTTNKHKMAMERLLQSMKQKLRRMRMEQRDQQRIIDEQNDNYARTSYCKLCKLNYKQSRQEHYTSDFHINMNEFLNSRCSVCRVSFGTPILYEHHLCTLTHIRRKAAHEKKGFIENQINDDDNEEDGFMVLDSVGSADESNDEEAGDVSTETNEEGETKPKSITEGKKKAQKIIGGEFIKQVQVHYCSLCKMCLHYSAHRDEDDYVAKHSRTRFHLKRYMLEKAKKLASKTDERDTESTDELQVKVEPDADDNEPWLDADIGESIKDEDEDSQPGNRYDRFKNSDGAEASGTLTENDSTGKPTIIETNPSKNDEEAEV